MADGFHRISAEPRARRGIRGERGDKAHGQRNRGEHSPLHWMDSVEQRPNEGTCDDSAEDAQKNSGGRDRARLPENHIPQMARGGPESRTDPQLFLPLADRIENRSIEAHRCEHKCQGAERDNTKQRDPGNKKREVQPIVHRQSHKESAGGELLERLG